MAGLVSGVKISRNWSPVILVSTSNVQSDEFVIMLQRPIGWWHVASPPLQVSAVHGLVSAGQDVPCDFIASAGHAAVEPVQFSATSQTPAALRQTVEPGLNAFAGQSFPVPLHDSGRSQPPAAERHTAVLFASGGHVALVPSQCSAGSQAPAEARHSMSEVLTMSAGQSSLVPSQDSATSQSPASGRQTAVLFPSAG